MSGKSTVGIWCNRCDCDRCEDQRHQGRNPDCDGCDRCDGFTGSFLSIGVNGIEGMSGVDVGGSGTIGADRMKRPPLDGPSETFADRMSAWDAAHGPTHGLYRFICGTCNDTVPMRADKLDEVARRIQAHPAEMVAAERLVLVNRVPHLKLSALRAMLSAI